MKISCNKKTYEIFETKQTNLINVFFEGVNEAKQIKEIRNNLFEEGREREAGVGLMR